jgi:magnesium transporter
VKQRLEARSSAGPATWLSLTSADPADLQQLDSLGIPPALLDHVHDVHERPRFDRAGDTVLIVLHYPSPREPGAPTPFQVLPLSILLTKERVVTITPAAATSVERVLERDVADLSQAGRARFILHLMFHLSREYLVCLDQINASVEALEAALRRSLRNEEVLELLRYEKSLEYFTTSLKANELLLERLQKGSVLDWSPEDLELLDDVLVEVRQALAMVEIAQNILGQMMDAFASIVSNNLNVVLKVLTSATIFISVPTLIASLYGMNVILPGARNPFAFAIIVSTSLLLTGMLVVAFRKKDWL